MKDAVRLAFGTLTVLPVGAPARVDRRTGAGAMVLAPLVGLVLGLGTAAVSWLLVRVGAPHLLSAALCVTLLVLLTRAIHLDGLADTADGLGSGKPPAQALAVMRRSDIGPFGVVTLLLVLLLQVSALASLLAHEVGPLALVVALVVSRLALPLACSVGVPGARTDGLGVAVAGTVTRGGLLVAVGLALGALAMVTIAAGSVSSPAEVWWRVALAAVVPLVLVALLLRRCVSRFGGVTGDVLGACVEVAATGSLVVFATL